MAKKIWTEDAIVEAIRRWAETHDGVPPAATNWNPPHARALGHPEKAEEFYAGTWPATQIVQNAFGTWSAAITAAGLVPRRVGEYGRPGENLAFCQEIRGRYEAGEKIRDLLRDYDCSAGSLYRRIRRAGGTATRRKGV